jgi:hypothetical protein
MLDSISTASLATPHTIRGVFLAKNTLTAKARAQIGADLIAGRAALGRLTVKQIADLCRVSVSAVNAARSGGVRKRSRDPDLFKAWACASNDTRLALIKREGAEAIWSLLTATL